MDRGQTLPAVGVRELSLPAGGGLVGRLEMHVTYVCTSRCTFCSEADRMRAFRRNPVTFTHLVAALRAWIPYGVSAVHLTGGEPTLHAELERLLGLARRLGLRTGIGTNGVRLANPAYAARVAPLLDEVMVSLHGPDADVHDAVTGASGSFGRAVAAIRSLRAMPPRVGFPGVNIVVTAANLAFVPATARLAVELGAGFVLVSNVSPEGDAVRHFERLVVRMIEVAAMAEAVMAVVGDGVPLRFFGFPACALGVARTRSNDLYWSPRVTVEWANVDGVVRQTADVSYRPDRGRGPVAACAECAWAGACPGPFRHYVAAMGAEGIQAIGGSIRGVNPSQP